MLALAEPIVVSIPQGDTNKYVIDKGELLALVTRKLIKPSNKLFVYIALNLDYPNGAKGMDVEHFCERWGIDPRDAEIAIAMLEKNANLEKQPQQLSFKFTYPETKP